MKTSVQWEYKIEHGSMDVPNTTYFLNQEGKDGWECFQVQSWDDISQRFYFKRKVPNHVSK